MSNSFKVEVIADRTGQWCGNSLRFATRDEAQAYGVNLSGRWLSVEDFRVVESEDPVNYVFDHISQTSRPVPEVQPVTNGEPAKG